MPAAILLPLLALFAPGGQAVSGHPLPCIYAPRGGEIGEFPDCARLDRQGDAHLAPAHFRRLDFDRHGLASAHVGTSWYYFRRHGASAPVMQVDNWAEDFADGRARSQRGGRTGFIDASLRLVVPRRYDGALPFRRGVAAVCTGCRIVPDGEHESLAGGSWTCIDRAGHALLPPRPVSSAVDLCDHYRPRR